MYLRKEKACVKSKGMKEIEEGFRVAVMPDERVCTHVLEGWREWRKTGG